MPFIVNQDDFDTFVREAAECDRKAADLRAYKKKLIRDEKKRQRMMLTGMDCLPGQLDLFTTDGGANKSK